MLQKLKENQFLFEELVKRDFKQKYKRTVLGMVWSLLSPLLQLLVMSLVFSQFFGRTTQHFTIYMFCGTLLFSYFRESTGGGMGALLQNASIFTKVNVPKYLFLFSKNVAALINFGLTLIIFVIFALIDHVFPTWKWVLLLYPIICLIIFNLGMGLILSALNVFFRDIVYLYEIFTLMLSYCSAIFYRVDSFPAIGQKLFMLNPIYGYIKYFRLIVLEGQIPSWRHHLICAGYALIVFGIGALIYKCNNHKFLYYV